MNVNVAFATAGAVYLHTNTGPLPGMAPFLSLHPVSNQDCKTYAVRLASRLLSCYSSLSSVVCWTVSAERLLFRPVDLVSLSPVRLATALSLAVRLAL